MVTQAPKRSAIAAALLFTTSCIGLIIFVWTQFGGTIPFSPQGYRFEARFRETGLLVPNADVRIAGVNVGKVAAVQNQGVYSLVTIEMQRQYAPIPRDSRAILRQKTLLGEAYVELSAGNGRGRTLADGGTLPATQVQDTQQLDQVLGSFDAPTQQSLQQFLQGSTTALAGRGQDLNNALGNLDPTVTELAALVGELNQQRGNVQSLINNTGIVLSTLGGRSADLQSLITAGDQVFSATAARDAKLTATVNGLPPFLAQLRITLGTLNTTLGIARPTLAALRPAAPLLRPALAEAIALSGPAVKLLHQAPGLLDAATAALPSITRFSKAFKPAVDVLLPAAREVVPIINFIAIYSRELTTAMANLGADLEGTAVANTTAYTAGTPAGQAHYLRSVVPINNESVFGQSVREPTNRHNGYYSPGEQANLASGLLASDCNNTGDPSQVPLPLGSGNVACRVQPGFPIGDLTQYYPHLKRSRLPK